jgi:UDP-glucose 4-epimerase
MITGGTGFLGATLARHLVHEEGHTNVVLFDNNPRPDNVADIVGSVSIVKGDAAEGPNLIAAGRSHGVEAIAHLGSAAGLPAPGQAPEYVRRQCLGTANVFESARVLGIKRVVNASSVSVWGDLRDEPVSEDDPASPRNLYGSHKLWSEHLADHYNHTFDMEILSLRMSAVFGYGRLKRLDRLSRSGFTSDQRGRRPHFTTGPELAVNGTPIVMPPDHQVVDFLYDRDNAYAWSLALTAPDPRHRVYNLRAEQRRAGDMADLLSRLMPEAQIDRSAEPIDRDQLMDSRRIRDDLGFAPRFPLERAMDDYLARIEAGRPEARTPDPKAATA